MKKLLLLFISVLCLGLGAYAETVSFASGALPTGWSGKKVQKATSLRPDPVTTPLQILGGGYIQSPEYKNVSSIKVSLNRTTKATTLTIAQSTDKEGKTWSTIKTIKKLECDPEGWKEFDVATTGDTSNGVMFKLSAADNSYYISSFEYTTYGEDATTAPEAPVISFGETTCTTGETYDIEYGAEVTVSSKDAESIIANSPVETAAEHTGNSYKFKISKSGDYTFKGKNKVGESATTTVTFNVKKPVGSGIVYSLVTSASDLVAGETYTIGCASKGTVMSTAEQTNYRDYVKDVDFTTGSFEIKSNMLALTLEQDGDGWKILTQNYTGTNGYFNAVDESEKKNNLLIDVETGAKWAIEIGEDESHNATISTPDFTNTRYIKWNPSYPRFSAYLGGQTEVQLYRETVVAPTLEVDGEVINTTGNVDVHTGSLIRIIGHEANELYYIHTSTTTANRAPVANTEGWTKHDSNIYEYTVPADFATKHITITAKGVKNGKESAPVSITLHNGSTTGIEGVESAENDAEVEWFTITGVRVQQPAEGGLYIRRQGSEVSKVRF